MKSIIILLVILSVNSCCIFEKKKEVYQPLDFEQTTKIYMTDTLVILLEDSLMDKNIFYKDKENEEFSIAFYSDFEYNELRKEEKRKEELKNVGVRVPGATGLPPTFGVSVYTCNKNNKFERYKIDLKISRLLYPIILESKEFEFSKVKKYFKDVIYNNYCLADDIREVPESELHKYNIIKYNNPSHEFYKNFSRLINNNDIFYVAFPKEDITYKFIEVNYSNPYNY